MAGIQPRLALGASNNRDVFDRTSILSLCLGDPNIGPGALGPLTRVGFDSYPVPQFDLRSVAQIDAPRGDRRTGYGSALQFDLDLQYETTSSGIVVGEEASDRALWGLVSLFGNSGAGSTRPPGTPFPPYLFLTTTYQMGIEQWIPVELDPNNAPTLTPTQVVKSFVRGLTFSLVSAKTYQKLGVTYMPAKHVVAGGSNTVSITAPGGGPPYNGTLVLAAALEAGVNVGDQLLVWFPGTGPYIWILFQITSISGPRTSIGVFSNVVWPASSIAGSLYRTFQDDKYLRTPLYTIAPFSGAPPFIGFGANVAATQLIGDLG